MPRFLGRLISASCLLSLVSCLFWFRKINRHIANFQAQLDDLQEAYSSLRANSAAEIRRLSREARDAAKFADEHSTKADEAMDQVRQTAHSARIAPQYGTSRRGVGGARAGIVNCSLLLSLFLSRRHDFSCDEKRGSAQQEYVLFYFSVGI